MEMKNRKRRLIMAMIVCSILVLATGAMIYAGQDTTKSKDPDVIKSKVYQMTLMWEWDEDAIHDVPDAMHARIRHGVAGHLILVDLFFMPTSGVFYYGDWGHICIEDTVSCIQLIDGKLDVTLAGEPHGVVTAGIDTTIRVLVDIIEQGTLHIVWAKV